MACIAAEPIVNGIKEEFEDNLIVIKIDIQSVTGAKLTSMYGSRVSPTFILLDGLGEEMWRSIGAIDPARVRESIQ